MSTARAAGTLRISVIVPAWGDAEHLASLLPALRRTSADEIIVVDASGEERSAELARSHGVTFMQ
ncbi:MAG TPA: hypothetical protein VG095_10030, partial [Chthoniobacterales bacterium]|nr:hypothetical protein [Chthoniobacterales bacterium]